MEIARWGGHIFEVSPEVIRSFDKLTVKSGSDTDEKTQNKQKYLTRKNGKATEVSLTATLNAFTGSDVRKEAMTFVDEAQSGLTDWIYIGGEKLVPWQMMLTDASVEEIAITTGGIWTRASVKLTFKQADLGDEKIENKKKKSTGDPISPFVEGFIEGVKDAVKDGTAATNKDDGKPLTAVEYIRQKGNEIAEARAQTNAAKEKGKKGTGVTAGGGKLMYEVME